jgi:hypothetical protein
MARLLKLFNFLITNLKLKKFSFLNEGHFKSLIFQNLSKITFNPYPGNVDKMVASYQW